MATQGPDGQCKNCTTPALLTTFTPPAACANYWTPIGSLTLATTGAAPDLTRNVTSNQCLLSELRVGVACSNCLRWATGAIISPGICPSGWPAVSTGIIGGVTTEYCCPSEAATYTRPGAAPNSLCYGNIIERILNINYNATSPIWTSSWDSAISSYSTWNIAEFETSTTLYVGFGVLSVQPIVAQYKTGQIPALVSAHFNADYCTTIFHTHNNHGWNSATKRTLNWSQGWNRSGSVSWCDCPCSTWFWTVLDRQAKGST
ncbi:hypothetical protein EK21DRAFT_85233 [Setomelanomma holmii]|uniref:Uncharacterized protein n=1 Tax=Setomelanomma holmii TaxID=210430 RepID=A0A9P4HK36_9PLEO|nr:hypothetical protein EK21DRAFT_85233 [Setomelanomma holmii]